MASQCEEAKPKVGPAATSLPLYKALYKAI